MVIRAKVLIPVDIVRRLTSKLIMVKSIQTDELFAVVQSDLEADLGVNEIDVEIVRATRQVGYEKKQKEGENVKTK